MLFMARSLAFVLDIFCSLALLQSVFEFLPFKFFQEKLSYLILPHWSFELIFFLSYFLIYQAINSLLFSVTFSQFLLGITRKGQFFKKRMKGVIQTILGTLLTFLIFPKFYLVLNQSDLSEKIAHSSLNKSRFFFPHFLIGLFINLIVIHGLLRAPFFNNNVIYRDYVHFEAPKRTLSLLKQEDNAIKVVSEKFKFWAFMNLENSQLIDLPSYDIVSTPNGSILQKKVLFFEKNKENTFYFKVDKGLNLFSILNDAYAGNPYLFQQFPYLNDLFNRKKTNKESEEVLKEVYEIMRISFELNSTNIYDFILSNGPFAYSFVKIKTDLMKQLNISENASVFIKRMGDKYTLSFGIDSLSGEKMSNIYEYRFVPLMLNDVLVYEIGYKGGIFKKEQFDKFVNVLNDKLINSLRFLSNDSDSQMNYFKHEYNSFYFIDKVFSKKGNAEFESKLSQFYFDRIKEILKLKDPNLENNLIQSFKELNFSVNLMEKKKLKDFTKEFILNIESYYQHLKIKDFEFFGV